MSFASMIAVLFADPFLAKSAAYLPKGGNETKTVRVMAKQPDTLTAFGDGQIYSSTSLFDIQVADVPQPQIGDNLTLNGITYVVQSEPMADRERIIWTLNVRPE